MSLSPGTRLGPYEIVAPIGVGGMGEVYRARDTKLGRDIAIKVLPDTVASDPERLARFGREAQMLASLNHPNIAHIYGFEDAGGVHALVMELVEGPTLAGRIARRPIPIEKALPIAKQIAEALEAAHEQGIIHRDLKPANIKVRDDGTVKVLDFGLAKALETSASNPKVTQSATLTTPAMMTAPGVILGTAAYMSPEQANGHAVDRASDVWAFGCVLYEMLSARAVFEGDSVSEILSQVLKSEPDWLRLPTETPEGIRRLLRRTLQKDRKLRLHHIADARIEIDDALSTPRASGRAAPVWSRRREWMAWLVALTLLAFVAAMFGSRALRSPPRAAEMRVDITTPPTADQVSLAISPDGQKIVFGAATSKARSQLWLRPLNSASARPLEGTEAASLPFWSPDSRSVGFFADGKLKRIDIDGGSATALANAPYGRGGAWNSDGAMLFVPNPGSPVLKMSATGGESVAVTKIDVTQQQQNPQFLPDGRHFLYYLLGTPDASGVYVGELGGFEAKRIVAADAGAVYASSGQLLFVRRGTLYAQAFDPVRLALGGSPFPVAEHVAVQNACAALSTSRTGDAPVVYRTGATDRQLVWFDQSGKEIGAIGDPNSAVAAPSFSPDARRVAVPRRIDGNLDVYLLDAARGGLNRFTFDAADDIFPVWSPDGTRIVFSSTRKGGLDLYIKSASGTRDEELLLATPQIKAASSWSPDGRILLYLSADPKTGFDIWALSVDGDRKPFPVIQTKSNERLARFSPDGKWIAYESDESGRYEIYLRPWSGSSAHAGGKVPISTTGGAQPQWRHDGKALFYIALDNRLMTVPIRFASSGEAVEPGAPVPLFATRVGGAVQAFPREEYLVSPDDRRILMVVEREDEAASPITVLLNWAGRKE